MKETKDSGKPRVRFAPSPTGALHIGGAHTALFNWLWARHTGGTFILRIEDTDRERSTAAYEQTIMDGMRWLGLDWDEGPDKGGDHGPYRQSERMDLYRRYADELLEKGLAYRDNGAVLFRVPSGEKIVFDDVIYGKIEVMSEKASVNTDGSIKDIVIIKSDGMPTYNYAVVIDDHTMDCTCIIRGEDHIINTPKQILMYRALGWDIPTFAHLPMILGRDKKKLSKRHGATSVFEYGDMGYLPESVFNFLALLGWTPAGRGSDDKEAEIFDRDEATKLFELSKVTRKSAVFDMDKLNFVSQEHLRRMDPSARLDAILPFWKELGLPCEDKDRKYLMDSLSMMEGRGKTTRELAEYTDYFVDFEKVKERYSADDISEESRAKLNDFFGYLFDTISAEDWNVERLEAASREWCENNSSALKEIAMPLRWALSGRKVSPGVFNIAAHMGREECMKRLAHYHFVKV